MIVLHKAKIPTVDELLLLFCLIAIILIIVLLLSLRLSAVITKLPALVRLLRVFYVDGNDIIFVVQVPRRLCEFGAATSI